ncbi:TVP38/TMEM64 family protein [Bacillus kwashiorkori]|uniref:TVP38/TMEM64 family protein n=1 Tax=Bacillus kwashiorkori TaxID=1522318 RepID=UPI000782FBEE|nr:TVP38/TMEM64 family protein [Bacillus kwashiorkori]
MDLSVIKEFLTPDNLTELIQSYRSFGPIIGITLPLIEAFLPFLPLFIFVMVNASAYGLWLGFLFSWIGACSGAMFVFWIVRKYGQSRALGFLKRHKQVRKFMDWLNRHGFGPLFLLLCFPFTPSSVVNIVAGLSKISFYQYALAVFTGKMVMIFTMSFVGYDIPSLIKQPIRTAIVLLIIFILWFVGKRIEISINRKVEKEHQHL